LDICGEFAVNSLLKIRKLSKNSDSSHFGFKCILGSSNENDTGILEIFFKNPLVLTFDLSKKTDKNRFL
jgi:hypothetical protein